MSTASHPFSRLSCAALAVLLSLGSVYNAQAETLEERLRNQLRSTTQQLQTLQSQQAQASAAQTAAQAQLSAAQAQVKQLTAELAAARGQSQQLAAQQEGLRSAAQAQVAASNEQTGKFKQAYEELLGRARGVESARVKLEGELAARDGEVQQCTAKNQAMYGIAQDILGAYERIGVSDVMKIRQPFAGSARVKFEELAQRYADDLYQTHFDAAQVNSGQ